MERSEGVPPARFAWILAPSDFAERFVNAAVEKPPTVLEDDFALTRNDPDTLDEQRFVSLGRSDLGKLLAVIYTEGT